LKTVKSTRQIIAVTHNANIPVVADAEYITSMDSESQYIKVLCSWTIDEGMIKKEICDVMEWSEKAFSVRSNRYWF
jgi:DNA repair ATPase RecN